MHLLLPIPPRAARVIALLTAVLHFAPTHAAHAAQEPRWQPLFNGRSLDGWVNVNCAPQTWTVRSNAIFCTGFPTGALRTTRQYENFILELEWRHLKHKGNAGVFIWAGPISAPGVPFLRAVEVQVLDHGYGQSDSYTTHGDVFPIHGSTMKPFGRSRGMRSFPSELRSNPSPQWNHYRIVATNGVLRLSVNGKEVSGGSDCIYRKGYIALESEGSPVEFRNLRLLELPPSGAPPEMSAPADTGWKPLYSGIDLRGWRSSDRSGQRWKPDDWRLTVPRGAPGASSHLQSTARFAPGDWLLDFRLPDKADPAQPHARLQIGGARGLEIQIGGTARHPWDIDASRLKPGSWHRLHLSTRTGHLYLSLNDQPVASLRSPAEAARRGPIRLVELGFPIEFASLYHRAP